MKKTDLNRFIKYNETIEDTRKEIRQEIMDLVEVIGDWILDERYNTARMSCIASMLEFVEKGDFKFEIDKDDVSILSEDDEYIFALPNKYLTENWGRKLESDFWNNHMQYFNISEKDLKI